MPLAPPELEKTSITPSVWPPGYELLSVIGSGGFGTVYKARQLKLDRTVAVKVLTPGGSDRAALSARFESEAVMLGQLHHPNVVQVYDFGHSEDRLFLAMELLDGEDLGQRLLRSRFLEERVAWGIARQAVAALAHAAEHKIVHRDIKPANIFLVPAPLESGLAPGIPLVKVMDFGLAKWAQPEAEHLTASGVMLGTPVYMAPEQFRQPGQVDLRADIYALGATIFHLLEGRPPFTGKTPWDVMAQKLEKKPRLGANVSAESAALVAAMMESDLQKRIGGYEELLQRIDALLVRDAIAAATPQMSMNRSRWMWAVAAVGVIVGTAIGTWSGRVTTRADERPIREAELSPGYESAGELLALFDGQTLNGWRPTNSGGFWQVEKDDEGVKVLAGSGYIRCAFDPLDEYRLQIGLDLHKAAAAEVHFAVASATNGPRNVLRVTRKDGAVLGIRAGEKGPFQARSEPVPFPPEAWFEDGRRRPYLEVKIERGGGFWTVWFNGAEVGRMNDDLQRASEVRLVAEGGRARVDPVILAALRKKTP